MIRRQEGQSTIEFILTFTFGLSAILVIFNSAMNYSVGYLVHYATFMSSRTYLTVDSESDIVGSSDAVARREATAAFDRFFLSRFGIPNNAHRINPQQPNMMASDYLMVGSITSYEREMDMLGKLTGDAKILMVSESFLGKEVTRAVCADRICYAMGAQSCPMTWDVTLFDDGC